jgi:alkylation response protein AidB-like acyl-CoA dehydrogenase
VPARSASVVAGDRWIEGGLMDFTLSETDEALRDLTARILGDQADPARHKAAEADARAGGAGVDSALWSALGEAGLLAAFLESAPAERPGVVAAALMCREAGATVAPVPLVSTLAALLAVRDCADPRVTAACAAAAAGAGWAAVATPELGGDGPRWAPVRADSAGAGVVLDGTVGLVADLPGAAWIVVEALDAHGRPDTYWVDASAPGVAIEHVVTTAVRAAGHLTLTSAPAIAVPAAPPAGLILQTLMCAAQSGVCASAIREAATYLGTRHQFGRPLSSFQAPVHRLVDAHIDTDAIWLTALLAAWRLEQRMDAAAAVDVARWWAADAGSRAVHTVQHLHGGIGADIDYPVHRYFLRAKALGDALGGGAAHLAHLGALIAAGADL